MTETCTIALRGNPTRKLKRKVRVFLEGGDVSVRVESGERYSVELDRNGIVLTHKN